jgi:hypothetical protein
MANIFHTPFKKIREKNDLLSKSIFMLEACLRIYFQG